MEKQRVHVNGIDLVYEECGSSNGKAIVLLHGFCGSSGYWSKICPLLSEQYRVIMPDLRGHGGSSAPEGTYTMDLMADDMAELLAALHIEKVVMFGHSLGGYVTAAFAEKYPDKLSGFGLIHSTVMPDSEETKEKRLADMEAIREKGISKYLYGIIPNLFTDEKLAELRSEVNDLIGVGQEMEARAVIATLEGMMQRPDRSHVLAEAKYPVLLVAGAEDAVIKPDDTFTVTSLDQPETTYKYPHILETTFEDVAHMSLVEVSDQLARVMSTYLKTLDEREKTRTEGKKELQTEK
ncbi:pimeloyl-ACP methyl ester carboxylesterase [Paenibacillus endophyticus]|uniref:Pimeloyl-ACP methyl ester carboxylesterase n=1 Tax=Paenibacillus endophyticus TaxID=1294268 RepID=A0A7W5C4E2_9BACL|nr:alpha/beta hydrolase [Paenibacillus endophyticus]MBB3151007.1 pimeloyl-ACP methyl ester carboxylesterase [Paenibacillus endophyticus]